MNTYKYIRTKITEKTHSKIRSPEYKLETNMHPLLKIDKISAAKFT